MATPPRCLGAGRAETEVGVHHLPTCFPEGPRRTENTQKSLLPDCFRRDLLDLLLLQIAQVFPTDFLEQRPRQDAPQSQVPAEQLLELENTIHAAAHRQGGKMLLLERQQGL